MVFDFLNEALNVIAGTALGGLGYVIEQTLTAADVAAGAMTAARATFYGDVVFGLIIAGAVFGNVGAKAWAARNSPSSPSS